ncbi:GAG-pre-integrase domain-containing protein, partial [Streptomyces albiflaviniger]|nr:GAG-pre-integrase domain-containing protein [Streptomyces albiflaviniger]
MTGGTSALDEYTADPTSTATITYGNNGKGKVLGFDKVAIVKDVCLETVLHVETLGYNLLPVRQLALCDFDVTFSKHYVKVFRSDNLKVAFVGHVEDNLYMVDFSKESTHLATCLMAKADVGLLWHRRLAHVGMRNLKQLLKG